MTIRRIGCKNGRQANEVKWMDASDSSLVVHRHSRSFDRFVYAAGIDRHCCEFRKLRISLWLAACTQRATPRNRDGPRCCQQQTDSHVNDYFDWSTHYYNEFFLPLVDLERIETIAITFASIQYRWSVLVIYSECGCEAPSNILRWDSSRSIYHVRIVSFPSFRFLLTFRVMNFVIVLKAAKKITI